MTLQPYSPERLDRLTLRMLDVCSRLRGMAQHARSESVDEFQLHDKKALEWIDRLEEWSQKSEADLKVALMRERGARRAADAAAKQ
jgi:hypothetical protein